MNGIWLRGWRGRLARFVFEPHSTQLEVFEEISQLAQSCVDGYNVCIFAYGQTGSGKSWTMEGGPTEDTAGMIPRAVEQVFRVAEEMKDKGWEYRIEGQFLEIYNETIHDLLTPFDASDKKKHEIKHDPKTGRTTVTELTVVPLTSPEQVKGLLARAQSRRSVAATLMNERSSRSHSEFTLRINGVHVGSRAMSSSSSSNTFGNGRFRPGYRRTLRRLPKPRRLGRKRTVERIVRTWGDGQGEGEGDAEY
ncbi:hypothetical protein NMY22_g19341 [Coprinellus aureogranulatus]|nr:hypothetical protein NMY22_g19341 [Coprinellus aureogranulatus]